MPDQRPDDDPPSSGGWLPPTGGDEPIARDTPRASAEPGGWLPPTDATYTPPAPDPYPEPQPRQPAPWSQPGAVVRGAENLGKATASLALSVVGLFLCPIVFSVAGIVLGQQARREIDAEPQRYANRGHAQWGVNLGWIGLAFGILLIVLFAVGALSSSSLTDS